jgi:uncharacterized membrane protein
MKRSHGRGQAIPAEQDRALLALAGIAALVHVYTFYLESSAWTDRKMLATFGMTAEQAEAMRPMALNQGFYNLFPVARSRRLLAARPLAAP